MGIGVCDNSGERAAMESKLKKLEAKVTSERQTQVVLEKECKKFQSQVRVLLLEEKGGKMVESLRPVNWGRAKLNAFSCLAYACRLDYAK